MNNRNSNTFKEIKEALDLNVLDNMPSKVGDTILPVIDVNPKKIKESIVLTSIITGATASNVTQYTVPVGKRVYITGVQLSNQSDVTADNISIYYSLTTKNGTSYICGIKKLTLTASTQNIFNSFDAHPILLESGDIISFTNSFTVGASGTFGAVFGFIIEKA